VVTYNRPEFLRRSLEDLRRQTYANLEIIIGDNGSDDERVEQIVCEFALEDPRVSVHKHATNIGPRANFAHVLKQASGEYFLWWSDDDRREAHFIEALVECLLMNPLSTVAFCDFDLVAPSGERLKNYEHQFDAMFPFQAKSAVLRSIRYFMQHPERQKQNSIYGLFRRHQLVEMIDTGMNTVEDQVFIYGALQRGSLSLSRQRLIAFTVGNAKHYDAKSVAGRTVSTKVIAELRGAVDEVKRIPSHVRASGGWSKVWVILLIPPKLTMLIIRLAVTVPYRFVRRRFVAAVGKI